jgi:outer membrane immunogenic protein
MRNVISFAVAAGFVAVATPALAQDQGSVERAPFTGPRVEVIGGWDRLSNENSRFRNHTDGFVYGLGAGYDVQFGGAIIGVEGDATLSTAKSKSTNIFVAGDRNTLRADRDLYIGARAGFAVTPSTLLYVKGGYTNARFTAQYISPTAFARNSGTLDGWRAGAGIEQKFNALGPGGFVKAEYRYSNYSNLNVGNFNQDVNVDRHQVVGAVGVRF